MMALWMLLVLAQDTTTPAQAATPTCPSGERYDEQRGCTPTLLDAQPAATSELLASAKSIPPQGPPQDAAISTKGITLGGGGSYALGALDRAEVDRVMVTTDGALHACYLPRVMERPTLEGTLVVKFVIAKEGTVSSATIKFITDSLRDEALAACVLKTTLGLRFPEPNGGGVVLTTYLIHFDASEATAPEAPKAPAP